MVFQLSVDQWSVKAAWPCTRRISPTRMKRTWRFGFQTSSCFLLLRFAKVAFGHLRNRVVDLAIGSGAKKFDVLGMGPHQWHS